MIAVADYHNLRAWLEACQRPLVVSHRRPDGDALGALAAMTLVLQDLGRDPRPVLTEPLPRRYALLADAVAWRSWEAEHAALSAACDAWVILDTCTYSQLGPLAKHLAQAPRTLVLDHHPTRDDLATRPGDLRLFDETAGAVCLLVYEWMRAVGLPLRPPIATALFVGLATDSGWFRFANADARMLRAAAELAEAGAAPHAIYRAIHEQDPPARLRLIGRMLNTLELHADGRLAVMQLRRNDFAAAGADHSMTEDLVNEAGRLAGLEAIVLFTEDPGGGVRVNFRSGRTGDPACLLDVAALAAQFGGGGHARASGARPPGPWDEVVARVVAATQAALAAVPSPRAAGPSQRGESVTDFAE